MKFKVILRENRAGNALKRANENLVAMTVLSNFEDDEIDFALLEIGGYVLCEDGSRVRLE